MGQTKVGGILPWPRLSKAKDNPIAGSLRQLRHQQPPSSDKEVEGFWVSYCHLARPSSLPSPTDLHLFKEGIRPLWEYVLQYIYENCDPANQVYYCDLFALADGLEGYKGKDSLLPFVKLIDTFEASYLDVANDGSLFTFRTNKDAPRYKLVRVDLNEPTSWTEVLQESEKDVLESAVSVNGNQLVVSYLRDVKNVLQLRDLKTGGLLHDIPFDIGTVCDIFARRKDSIIFIKFTPN